MHRSTFKISDNDLIFLIKPLHPWRSNASAPGLLQLPLAGATAAAPQGSLCWEHHAVGWSARRMLIQRKGGLQAKLPQPFAFPHRSSRAEKDGMAVRSRAQMSSRWLYRYSIDMQWPGKSSKGPAHGVPSVKCKHFCYPLVTWEARRPGSGGSTTRPCGPHAAHEPHAVYLPQAPSVPVLSQRPPTLSQRPLLGQTPPGPVSLVVCAAPWVQAHFLGLWAQLTKTSYIYGRSAKCKPYPFGMKRKAPVLQKHSSNCPWTHLQTRPSSSAFKCSPWAFLAGNQRRERRRYLTSWIWGRSSWGFSIITSQQNITIQRKAHESLLEIRHEMCTSQRGNLPLVLMALELSSSKWRAELKRHSLAGLHSPLQMLLSTMKKPLQQTSHCSDWCTKVRGGTVIFYYCIPYFIPPYKDKLESQKFFRGFDHP